MKQAPQFRQIQAPLDDVDDSVLDAINEKLGVPTLQRPKPAQSEPPAPRIDATAKIPANGEFSESVSASSDQTDKKPSAARKTAPAVAPPLPPEKLTIELPAYLAHALRRQAAEKRLTARHLVMQGLQALGFAIEARDLIPDARRTRPRAGKP